jgi:hypothetical protein
MAQTIDLTGGLPPEILGQQQQLNRQQQMAKMLMQQGQQMPQGQMVSGRYVQPSIFASLAPLAQMYAGQTMLERGDKKALELAAQLRTRYGDELEQFRKIKQGTPAVEGGLYAPDGKLTMQTTADMIGPQGEILPSYRNVASVAGVAPNPQGAYDFAARASNPLLQQIGMKKLTEGPIKVGIEDVLLDPIDNKVLFQGAGKDPEKIRTAAIVLGLDSKPRKDWTPQDRAMIDAQIQKTAQSGAMNLGQKGLDNTLKLRGDFRSEPIYKDFQAIDSAYRQINKGLDAGTAAGDLAASTKLMKLLDPTSVVRESELVMAMQATGKLDQLYNYANKIATGQFLSPKQKGEFRSLATEFYNSAGEQYNFKRDEYAGIAERNQLNVPDVVGNAVKLKPQIIRPPEGKNKPASAEKVAPAPTGIPQKTWEAMTPQERALWQ